MEKIKQDRYFNQEIKKEIVRDRYLSWSARLVKIGCFALYFSFFTLTKTCLATEPLGDIRPQCGSGNCHNCPSKLGGMRGAFVATDAVIDQHGAVTPTRNYSDSVERDERDEILHSAVAVRATPSMNADSVQKLIFKIEGMCCSTEAGILKDALHPFLNKEGREVDVSFDLINGKLIVEIRNGTLPDKEEIIKEVGKTGMQASLWNEHVKQSQEQKTFWERYGRYGLNLTSAAGLAAGLIIHAVNDGANAAFGGGVEGAQDDRPGYPPIASMTLYSASIVAGVWFIVPKAIRAIKRLRPDQNILMLTAVGGAIGINQWFEAASAAYLFSAAELLESWNTARARNAIRTLMELAPSTAQVVNEDGTIEEQLVENVPVGTIITVRPGEKIPMDSVLMLGSASVNQAPITGESMPIHKEEGDALFAGTINEDSVIQCKVMKASSDSTLSSIIRKVEESQTRRSRSEQWIEKFSQFYVPAVALGSVATIVIPPLATGDSWYPWVYKGLELLVISCPCSLTISTPVSIVAGISAAARAGVLIKGGIYLETAAGIEAFAMDKTGTLTTGLPRVDNIIPLNGYDIQRLLKVAAALEAHSDHPLARAIKRKAKEDGITTKPAESFQIFKGKGGEGSIDGELFWIGSHRYLNEKVVDNDTEIHEQIEILKAAGHSIVAVGTDQTICGLISITDTIRPESKSAIEALKKAKVKRVVMLTGDNEGAANAIATSVGIDEYHAELLPEDKVHQIEELMKRYKRVAMVGDGINDAPAMALSSLGIAMGAMGSDAAIETADIALMSDDLSKLAWLVEHSRHTLNVIKQNVAISLLVKGALAGVVFANKGALWMALVADMGTSFVVVSNGLRLLNNKPEATA